MKSGYLFCVGLAVWAHNQCDIDKLSVAASKHAGRAVRQEAIGPDGGVVGILARVLAYDPSLYQAIDAARRMDRERGDVQLELGTHRVLLGPNAGPEVIQAVMLVARDLAAKARPYTELDGRYAGQVIVRRRPRNGSA